MFSTWYLQQQRTFEYSMASIEANMASEMEKLVILYLRTQSIYWQFLIYHKKKRTYVRTCIPCEVELLSHSQWYHQRCRGWPWPLWSLNLITTYALKQQNTIRQGSWFFLWENVICQYLHSPGRLGGQRGWSSWPLQPQTANAYALCSQYQYFFNLPKVVWHYVVSFHKIRFFSTCSKNCSMTLVIRTGV